MNERSFSRNIGETQVIDPHQSGRNQTTRVNKSYKIKYSETEPVSHSPRAAVCHSEPRQSHPSVC